MGGEAATAGNNTSTLIQYLEQGHAAALVAVVGLQADWESLKDAMGRSGDQDRFEGVRSYVLNGLSMALRRNFLCVKRFINGFKEERNNCDQATKLSGGGTCEHLLYYQGSWFMGLCFLLVVQSKLNTTYIFTCTSRRGSLLKRSSPNPSLPHDPSQRHY